MYSLKGFKNVFNRLLEFLPVALFFLWIPNISWGTTLDVSTPNRPEAKKGSTGQGSGAKGGPGADGRSADHAGNIEVELIAVGSDEEGWTMKISGQMEKPVPRSSKNSPEVVVVDETVPINESLLLDGQGGNGAKGGEGGDGTNGPRGSSGSNATRYSAATRGGPGGRGGNSGQPGAGGNGGNGGQTLTEVAEKDMDLLMNVTSKNSGGKAGPLGDHGTPGCGGPGGRGGSGCSWTTTERYTDSEGKSRTRTKYHSRPGASNGPKGPNGKRPTPTKSAGRKGDDGKHTYIVNHENGKTVSYDSRYNIDVLDFTFRSQNEDLIYEPGEKVIVGNIVVKNTGGMPTPSKQKVRLFVNGNEWVLPDENTLEVPKVLQPGEQYKFPGELHFDIKNIEVVKRNPEGGPFRDESFVDPRARLDRVERVFPDVTQKGFVIQFPIEMSPIKGLHSLMSGEGTRLSWVIKNISNRNFGENSELKRVIESHMGLGESDIGAEQVKYIAADGTPFELSNDHMTKLLELGPGEEITVNAKVYVDEKVGDYQNLQLRHHLDLGRIEEPETGRPIQIEEHNIKTARGYKPIKGAEFLLVTNNRTTDEEVAAWEKFSKLHGRELVVWDLSYHGHLDLSQNFSDNQHILDDFSRDTIILANGVFDPSPEKKATPSDYLTRKDLLLAAGKYGVSLYIPGQEFDMSKLLTPITSDEQQAIRHEARVDFNKNLEILQKEFPEFKFTPIDEPGTEQSWEMKIEANRKLWGNPKKETLQKRAEEMKNKMAVLFPDFDHAVAIDFEPMVNEQGKLDDSTFRYASVRVRQVADKNKIHYNSPKDFYNSLKRLRKEFPDFSFEPHLSDETEHVWEMDVTLKKDVWVVPSEEKLEKIASDLNLRLEKLFPERSYRVIFDFAPELKKHVPFLSKTWSYGSVQVRRAPDVNIEHVVNLPVQSDEVHKPSFILGAQNTAGMYKAMRPETKIEILRELAFSGKNLSDKEVLRLNLLTKTLLADIALEQIVARRDKQYLKSSVNKRTPILFALSEISKDPILAENFLSTRANSKAGHAIARFIADVEYLLDSQVKWYEHLWPGPSNEQSTDAGKSLLSKFRKAAFEKSQYGVLNPEFKVDSHESIKENRARAKQMIDKYRLVLDKRQKRSRKESKIDKRVQGIEYARAIMTEMGLITDVDQQPSITNRVLPHGVYVEDAMEGLERAEEIDRKINATIASRNGLLLNQSTGEEARVSFKKAGDRYFEGKKTVKHIPGTELRQSDPELRMFDPSFEQLPAPKASFDSINSLAEACSN